MKRSANRKIKNATPNEYKGLKFRSKLETYTYRRLIEEGFNFKYENIVFELQEAFVYNDEKFRNITMKPDFVDDINNIIVEVKGYMNDVYPLKRKMLRYYFYKNNINYTIFEVKNQKEVEEVISKLKSKNV